ncbi:MAG: extracellular solute-binding protein [Kiritimatiellia bacterium]|jgi:raffinose/stachyose/melibiose transport system substrate-binding protein|nr:extracellular solute-binding protein [Kiritimatiellia bacterium]MDP6630605.1 extracellular solute-binding protein [Kiritimatiellia bacterium]MDP6811310.1 extracellular solute-binding protein [Kiritimatiellia bacterium]MDP7024616.1 extracellular solute-binding protein [Kiritimatiellia bacterium]
MIGFLRKQFALLMVIAVYVWAIVAIAVYRRAEAPPEAITLRIGHWQLEASVREALDHMAEQYRREVNPNVYIVQDAIPEMVYGQWLTTQLMGGTAPDMLEIGLGLPYHLIIQYYNRYFLPMSDIVDLPNPHNAGTPLEGVPLRSTFKDGMRNSYIEELQQFMNVPLSQFGVRIFYNRDLLMALTGRETAPSNYREFLRVCEMIKAHKDPEGEAYIAIAGSKYHLPMWESMMFDPLTYGVSRVADFNRDGFVSNHELYVGFKTGRVDFEYPPIKARYRMLREVSSHFQTGYTGLTRDEAVFLFAQKRAVFITTGTWDARSLQQQAEGQFEVGVMDFPRPTADDPTYGSVVEGPTYEKPAGGFPFAVTRTCKHPEVARDFLLYLASHKKNEELNKIIGWIPAVRETKIDPFLEAFQPHLVGVYGCLNLFLGGETWVKWLQLYSLYQVQQLSYEDMTAEFAPFYIKHGLKDYLELQKDWRRGMQKNELFLAGIRADAMLAPDNTSRSKWLSYLSLTTARQVTPEIGQVSTVKMVMGERSLPKHGPYEYSPEVIAAVKARLVGNE